ncbi:MAG: AraC family transcriptional regulator [Burkholderiales bacterium PBB3]|nr:MAG: AraC family transcriptional regulator [Burkholderiales bacterium PBB3]
MPTEYPRLLIRSTVAPTPPMPALFEPKFYLLLQGAKRMTIAGRTFDCSAGTCAVASIGLPFVSEVVEASPTQPYLSVELTLDAGIVASLLLDMREQNPTEWQAGAISLAQVEVGLVEPLGRLLNLLDAPSEIPVLAAQIERELYYRLLSGPLGGRLRQIGANNSRFAQIKMAAEWIGENANNPMSVEWLAAHVGMSVTSFHRHFKAVTASSPLAYQRQLRLLEARRQLASGEANVTQIAYTSGYVSASQFSREYKKAFGVPPSQHAVLLRP